MRNGLSGFFSLDGIGGGSDLGTSFLVLASLAVTFFLSEFLVYFCGYKLGFGLLREEDVWFLF